MAVTVIITYSCYICSPSELCNRKHHHNVKRSHCTILASCAIRTSGESALMCIFGYSCIIGNIYYHKYRYQIYMYPCWSRWDYRAFSRGFLRRDFTYNFPINFRCIRAQPFIRSDLVHALTLPVRICNLSREDLTSEENHNFCRFHGGIIYPILTDHSYAASNFLHYCGWPGSSRIYTRISLGSKWSWAQ